MIGLQECWITLPICQKDLILILMISRSLEELTNKTALEQPFLSKYNPITTWVILYATFFLLNNASGSIFFRSQVNIAVQVPCLIAVVFLYVFVFRLPFSPQKFTPSKSSHSGREDVITCKFNFVFPVIVMHFFQLSVGFLELQV